MRKCVTDPEECHGGTAFQRAVRDLALLRQVLDTFYWHYHALYGKEGGQVGRVRRSVPYEILLCSARSSTLSIGVIMRSTVRKAARLAVYDEGK
ncbi:hypothetical protein CEXT_717381 [Caerostris extrusa]|uniref:Maturase K n=1 Tax=Caerostris extrusa TaxID=172846 RepID=A0AAV4Y4K4_CAEEX|nr:hypothetical protein CEXT_717381 [Caerostris extrusa]